MRFRRHQSTGIRWNRWFGWLERVPDLVGRPGQWKNPWILGSGVVVAAFLAGYVVAALFLFPAPIFARSQEVPRLLELQLDAATAVLQEAGLVPSDTDFVNHPELPRGRVVWQDPPAAVAVPEGTGVALSVSRGPQRVPVPDVTGFEQGLAVRLIQAAGLRVASIDTSTAPQERGVVVNTRPPARQSLEPGDGVTLFVSVGAPTITVPDLTDLTIEEAREILELSGLALGSTQTRSTTMRPPGIIIEQQPAAGTLSAPGAAVNVIVVRENQG